jgi:hypothetical protein
MKTKTEKDPADQVADIRRVVDEAHSLTSRVAKSLHELNDRYLNSIYQPCLRGQADVLLIGMTNLRTDLETWEEDIRDGWQWTYKTAADDGKGDRT